MKRWRVVMAVVGLVGVLCAASARSQNRGREPGGEKKSGPARKWGREMGMPGEEHARLAALVGEFKGKVEIDSPDGQKSEGTANLRRKWICGKRFVMETMSFKFANGTAEGTGIFGYDKVQQHYTLAWVDDGTTSTLLFSGSWDEAKKTLTLSNKHIEGATGKMTRTRLTYSLGERDSQRLVQEDAVERGEFHKSFEWNLTRKD